VGTHAGCQGSHERNQKRNRMSKATEVIWFSTGSGTMGIVLSDNGHDKKAYIGQVYGIIEEQDIKDVMENGAKISLEQAQSIVKHLI